jgi:hypothetical protein
MLLGAEQYVSFSSLLDAEDSRRCLAGNQGCRHQRAAGAGDGHGGIFLCLQDDNGDGHRGRHTAADLERFLQERVADIEILGSIPTLGDTAQPSAKKMSY